MIIRVNQLTQKNLKQLISTWLVVFSHDTLIQFFKKISITKVSYYIQKMLQQKVFCSSEVAKKKKSRRLEKQAML